MGARGWDEDSKFRAGFSNSACVCIGGSNGRLVHDGADRNSLNGDMDSAEMEKMLRLIREAGGSGATELSLQFLPIERLPEEIRELPHLQQLNLCGCAALTDVQGLDTSEVIKVPLRCPGRYRAQRINRDMLTC